MSSSLRHDNGAVGFGLVYVYSVVSERFGARFGVPPLPPLPVVPLLPPLSASAIGTRLNVRTAAAKAMRTIGAFVVNVEDLLDSGVTAGARSGLSTSRIDG
jgi:hypothetical protein